MTGDMLRISKFFSPFCTKIALFFWAKEGVLPAILLNSLHLISVRTLLSSSYTKSLPKLAMVNINSVILLDELELSQV